MMEQKRYRKAVKQARRLRLRELLADTSMGKGYAPEVKIMALDHPRCNEKFRVSLALKKLPVASNPLRQSVESRK